MYGCSEEDAVALTVAHNFKLKGVRPLLGALATLSREDRQRIKVLVAGKDGTVRWEALSARLGLGDCVRFCGPTRRIRSFYHAADFLVHPTFYDPCSRVVLEAQASGLPAITTRYDGAAETIEDGVSGFVLEVPDDVSTLANRISRLLDGETRDTMRSRVKAAEGAYDMRRHAEEVVAAYNDLIEETR